MLSRTILKPTLSSAFKNNLKLNSKISTIPTPPTITSILNDKGLAIPFANKLLTPGEYKKYALFRSIKTGDTKLFEKLVGEYSIQNEEKETFTSYINSLKTNSLSLPNFIVGSGCVWFGFKFFGYSLVPLALIGVSNTPIDTLYHFLNPLSIASSMGLFACGYKSAKYGGNLIISEMKSPYYDYDEMLRVITKSTSTNKHK